MAAIVEKQRIAKRQRSSASKHTNKSAGFNSGFMSHFDQKPAHGRKKMPKKPKVRNNMRSSSRSSTRRQASGFSFPVPSFATIAVVAGTLVIALTAVNWEGIEIKTPDIYAIQPAEDSETTEKRVVQYAATGISSLFPEKIERNEAPAKEEIAAASQNHLHQSCTKNLPPSSQYQQILAYRMILVF